MGVHESEVLKFLVGICARRQRKEGKRRWENLDQWVNNRVIKRAKDVVAIMEKEGEEGRGGDEAMEEGSTVLWLLQRTARSKGCKTHHLKWIGAAPGRRKAQSERESHKEVSVHTTKVLW